jgi:uncharacterized protein
VQVGRLPVSEQVEHFRAALCRNRTLIEVLDKAAEMELPGWYLAAGCLCQTVWNVETNRWRRQWPTLTVLPWPED